MSGVIIGNVSVSTSCTCIANYRWEVYNYWICTANDRHVLVSPEFLASHDSNPIIWTHMLLYPKGMSRHFEHYFALFAKIASTTAKIIEVSLSIFNNEVEIITKRFDEPVFEGALLWGAPDFMHRNLITEPRSNDNLTIVLKISTEKSEKEMSVLQLRKKIGQLQDDYEKLVDNKDFSDVKLIIGDKSLRAHKFILNQRCPRIAAMFRKKRGKQECKIEILGFKYEVCLEMLRYIYAERVNNIEDIADELLAAAHKYGLEGLKRMCEKCLSKSVTVDNVFERLRMAHFNNAEMLKVKALGVFLAHSGVLSGKPEFRELPRAVVTEIIMAECNRKWQP